jgi:hypothetical protein
MHLWTEFAPLQLNPEQTVFIKVRMAGAVVGLSVILTVRSVRRVIFPVNSLNAAAVIFMS